MSPCCTVAVDTAPAATGYRLRVDFWSAEQLRNTLRYEERAEQVTVRVTVSGN